MCGLAENRYVSEHVKRHHSLKHDLSSVGRGEDQIDPPPGEYEQARRAIALPEERLAPAHAPLSSHLEDGRDLGRREVCKKSALSQELCGPAIHLAFRRPSALGSTCDIGLVPEIPRV